MPDVGFSKGSPRGWFEFETEAKGLVEPNWEPEQGHKASYPGIELGTTFLD